MSSKPSKDHSLQPHQIAVVQSRAVRNMTHLRERTLREHDITSPEWFVLSNVNESGRKEGLRVGDIARALDVQSTYITGTLRQLTSKKLVELTVDEEDRRARFVTLTKAGQALIKIIDVELTKSLSAIVPISDKAWQNYVEVLTRFAEINDKLQPSS